MKEVLEDPLDALPRELIRQEDGTVVTVTKHIPSEEYDILWDMVETGFRELNQKSYEKQDMTREELEADLDSPNVLKYVYREEDGSISGFFTVHIGLDDISWTDVDRLSEYQYSVGGDSQPYYLNTLVVPVDRRGTEVIRNLLRAALIHFQDVNEQTGQNSLVFFDCAEANYPWLGRYVNRIGRPSPEFPDLRASVEELYADAWVREEGDSVRYVQNVPNDQEGDILDRQHYYALSIMPKSRPPLQP